MCHTQAACTVQVGGTSNTFSACTALAGLSSAFRFSWTYDIASRTLHGALQGSSPTGYFALGLSDPSTPTKMAGSNAIVVQQDTAAASGVISLLRCLHPRLKSLQGIECRATNFNIREYRALNANDLMRFADRTSVK